MDAHTCNHPLVPHTVWWWPNDGGYVPMSRTFDNLEDADHFAQKIIRSNDERISWLKIFRADNESYTCYRWDNPKENQTKPSEQKVKLEVDMEPMKEAFDNISLGFKNHGKAIRKLRAMQYALGLGLLADGLVHLLT